MGVGPGRLQTDRGHKKRNTEPEFQALLFVSYSRNRIFEIGIPFGIKRIPDSQNLNPFQKKTESKNHPDKRINGLIRISIQIYRKFLLEMVYINPIAIFYNLLSPLTPLCELVKVPL